MKTILKSSTLLKKLSPKSSFINKVIVKHEKPVSKLQKTLMSSGGVTTLDGYWKDKYENFLGVAIPRVRIHRDHNAIERTIKYQSYSYAQGIDIYLGKDIKPIDTLEGQMTLAHEITHVLQQKYLDMSSSRGMIDPSVELEQKAKGIEGIVKFRRGLDQSAYALIKKRDLLPFKSYQVVPMFGGSRFLSDRVIQRWGWNPLQGVGEWIGDKVYDNRKEIKSAVSRGYKQVKSIGGSLVESGGTLLDTGFAGVKYVGSGYTSLYAEGAGLLGYNKVANKYRKVTDTLQKSAKYDLNSASSHLWKAGKHGKNFLNRAIGGKELHKDGDISNTKGMIETFDPTWKKDDKYNKSINNFLNSRIGKTFSGINELSGGFFNYKSGGWQDKIGDSLNSAGDFFNYMDKDLSKKKGFRGGTYSILKGFAKNFAIDRGKDTADKLLKGNYFGVIQDVAANTNLFNMATNAIEGTVSGSIDASAKHGLISEKDKKRYKGYNRTTFKVIGTANNLRDAKSAKLGKGTYSDLLGLEGNRKSFDLDKKSPIQRKIDSRYEAPIQRKVDNEQLIGNKTYSDSTHMKFAEDADKSYSLEPFYDKKNNKFSTPKNLKQQNLNGAEEIRQLFKMQNKYNLIFSKMEKSGLETYLERQSIDNNNDNFDLNYKFIFRGTWPKGFDPKSGKQSIFKFDKRDIVEDAWNRGKEQAKSAKKIYQNYMINEQSIFNKYKTKFQINMNFNEMNFIGHSLGGYLANSVMIDFVTNRGKYGGMQPKKIYAETYNALGLTIEEYNKYNQYKKNNPNKNISSVSHRTEYDPVSHIGVQPEHVVMHKLKNRTIGNKLGAHGMGNFLKRKNYNNYSGVEISKDKPTWFDRYIVDNDIARKGGILGALTGTIIGAKSGGAIGATVGSFLGPVGTLAGGAIGGVLGGIGGALIGGGVGILGGFAINGLKWLGNKVVDGSKWLGNKAIDGAKWVGDKAVKGYNLAKKGASWLGNKAVDGSKWLGNKAIDGAKWVGDKAVKGYNLAKKGTSWLGNKVVDGSKWLGNKVIDGTKWVGDKVSNAKDSVFRGVNSAYKFGEDKVSQASSYIVNKTQKMSNIISSGAKSAYSFGEKKLKQFGGTVSKGWDSVSSLFKFAELNRHQNQSLSQNREIFKGSESLNSLDSMENQLDEFSMRIFRQLKSEIALEYVRSGRN